MSRATLVGVLSCLALADAALAQQPPITLPPGFGAPVPTGPVKWVAQDVASVRFLGEQLPGPALKKGEQVEVILEDGAMTRVKAGTKFGWVPSAALTDEAPAVEPAPVPVPAQP